MGKGSTQVQHLVQTEVPVRLLDEWLGLWAEQYGVAGSLHAELRPHAAGSELLTLNVVDSFGDKKAGVIFTPIQDRRGQHILSMRYQETYDTSLRRKRLMTLLQLFLIHRYKVVSIHYVSPNEENEKQADRMKAMGIFAEVTTEVGHIIVAAVDADGVAALLETDRVELEKLIGKGRREPAHAE
jgi:isocitrate lyase